MKQIYLFLAALLLLCLAPMPYGYFQLVRFVATVAFGLMAYRYFTNEKTVAAWIFSALALLFQPIYKIALGRVMWNVVDVLVAVLLVALFVMEKRGEEKGKDRKRPLSQDDSLRREDDNRYEFRLEGKLAPKELIYVASEEDKALTEVFEKQPEMLQGWGQMIGFQVIYLPLLMKRLQNRQVLRYRAPYLTDAELTEVTVGSDFLLQYLEHPADRKKIKQGFIRTEDVHRGSDGKDKAVNRFYPLSSKNDEPLADQLHHIGRRIAAEQGAQKRLTGGTEHREQSYEGAENGFNSQIAVENTDDLIEEVRERIAKLRQRGISQYILEQLIHPDDRLSRLVITRDYRLLLPDYGDMEIKMEPLVKAVYLLFLNHPEGILFKHLPGYREELTQIYARLRPTGLTERAVQSIEDVTNPMLNSINEKCARIRGAFVGEFDDHMARHYYIDGLRGEVKKIDLPRHLVVRES